jgi:hypothetical protein
MAQLGSDLPLKMGATKTQFDATVAVHPTMARRTRHYFSPAPNPPPAIRTSIKKKQKKKKKKKKK